jgi:hypothetical protein
MSVTRWERSSTGVQSAGYLLSYVHNKQESVRALSQIRDERVQSYFQATNAASLHKLHKSAQVNGSSGHLSASPSRFS